MLHARHLATALLTATSFLASSAYEASASKLSCEGRDMLAEIGSVNPEAHREIMSAAQTVENDGAILWRIEKPGLPPSHLFGTLHLTDERVTQLPPEIDTAIAGSSTVLLEVANRSTAATGRALSQSGRLLVYLDGRRLDHQLNEEEFVKARNVLARAGMPSDFALLFRPWLVSMFLAVPDCERRRMQQGERVLDMHIAERAQQQGLDVIGLETMERQFDILASVPNDEQVGMLRTSLATADRSNDVMETMVQLYLNRRMGAAWPFQMMLAKQAGAADGNFDGYQERVLFRRNLLMKDRALPMLAQGRVFMAVGALHLVGKEGLVALLRDEGFTVSPVL